MCIGSKVFVFLVVESKVKVKLIIKLVVKVEVKLCLMLEEELIKLENDECLDVLLDRFDNDEVLSKEDQVYVDLMLDCIDVLME